MANTLIDQILAQQQGKTGNTTGMGTGLAALQPSTQTTEPQLDISGWTPQMVNDYVMANPGKLSQATLDKYAASNNLTPPTTGQNDLAQGQYITTQAPTDLAQGQYITTSGTNTPTQYNAELSSMFDSLMNNQNQGNNSFLGSLSEYDPAKTIRESGTVPATRPGMTPTTMGTIDSTMPIEEIQYNPNIYTNNTKPDTWDV